MTSNVRVGGGGGGGGGPVVFDTATSAEEVGGDGVITLSHTSTGSDLGGFVGVGYYEVFDAGSASCRWGTAGGTGGDGFMTELWDIANPSESGMQLAGYRIAGQASGAQNIVSTLVGTSPNRHFVGSISMTGVNQGAPVGTPNTASGTASPATVTVASTVADGLVCDVLHMLTGVGSITVGANQTQRFAQDDNAYYCHGSTQDGGDGGVMSWTDGGPDWWSIGAVEFKPA